ncbi:aspartate aminotransferase family protein, partial [Streptomyces sp. MCAF7]
LRSYGRDGMADMVDRCHELARYAAARIAAEPRLELAAEPTLSTVLFRYLPAADDADAFNGALRRRLMADGTALLARTRIPQPDGTRPVFLKAMLLNPATTASDLDRLIDDILVTAETAETLSQLTEECESL